VIAHLVGGSVGKVSGAVVEVIDGTLDVGGKTVVGTTGEGVVGTTVVVVTTVTPVVGGTRVVVLVVDVVDVDVVASVVVVGSTAGEKNVTVKFLPVAAAVTVIGVIRAPLMVTVTPVPVIKHGVAAARIRLNWTAVFVGMFCGLIHVVIIATGVMVTVASAGVNSAISLGRHGPCAMDAVITMVLFGGMSATATPHAARNSAHRNHRRLHIRQLPPFVGCEFGLALEVVSDLQ
jgi:hypothetical protein